MIHPSSLIPLQGWGLIDLPLRASNEGLPRPRVARAQKIIRPSSPPLFREHRSNVGVLPIPFIVGALRARRMVWPLPSGLSKPPRSPLQKVAWLILDFARRTSTFLSCAFREQEDDQATLPRSFLLSQVLKHISNASSRAL